MKYCPGSASVFFPGALLFVAVLVVTASSVDPPHRHRHEAVGRRPATVRNLSDRVLILSPEEHIVSTSTPVKSSSAPSADTVVVTASGSNLTSPAQVKVSWSGVPNPTSKDVIGVFTAGTPCSDPMQIVPTPGVESGFIIVKVVGMRSQDYDFRYMSGGKKGDCLGSSFRVSFDPTQTTQVHLSLTERDGEMMVMWVSSLSAPYVKWGSSPTSLTSQAKGTYATYNVSDLCGSPANTAAGWRTPGNIHKAIMTGLTPSTTYYYAVGDIVDGAMSAVLTFTTPPLPGDYSKPIELFLFGDLGVAPWYGETALAKDYAPANGTLDLITKAIDTSKHQMVLHIGDISYARGYAWQWDQFFTEIEPIAATLPYMVGEGNHEYDYPGQSFKPSWSNYGSDSGGECGVPYDARFDMPGPGGNHNLWYSFDYGPVHFVMMATERDFLVGSSQYEFIAQDLQNVNKTVTPFIIFSGHRPMYTSSEHKSQDGIMSHMREAYEPLFVKYGVDLALWGHVHQYERTCAFSSNYTCVSKGGTVHAVVGNAGNDYLVPWVKEPTWSVFRSEQFGFSRLNVFANQTALFEFVGNTDGQVLDSFWIGQAQQ